MGHFKETIYNDKNRIVLPKCTRKTQHKVCANILPRTTWHKKWCIKEVGGDNGPEPIISRVYEHRSKKVYPVLLWLDGGLLTGPD